MNNITGHNVYCKNCNKLILAWPNGNEPFIRIEIVNSLSYDYLSFHIPCFQEVAGSEYMPPTREPNRQENKYNYPSPLEKELAAQKEFEKRFREALARKK